jgi:hypothetical protein
MDCHQGHLECPLGERQKWDMDGHACDRDDFAIVDHSGSP